MLFIMFFILRVYFRYKYCSILGVSVPNLGVHVNIPSGPSSQVATFLASRLARCSFFLIRLFLLLLLEHFFLGTLSEIYPYTLERIVINEL